MVGSFDKPFFLKVFLCLVKYLVIIFIFCMHCTRLACQDFVHKVYTKHQNYHFNR